MKPPLCEMCMAGFPLLCQGISCGSSQVSLSTESDHSPTSLIDEEESLANEEDRRGHSSRSTRNAKNIQVQGTRRTKRDAALKDQQSTGRKRAARMYPLDRTLACEWKLKANCGGGLYPILGCFSGVQEARHHGPDKSTSNNEEGNVHRICYCCHNRWHAVNNPDYDWEKHNDYASHNPRDMTAEERTQAAMIELEFKATKPKKVRD